MNLTLLATVLKVLATALLGLMAGFFFAFAVDVAPAMRELDAQAYITTQQAINRVVRNALFGGVYFGSVLLPALTTLALYASGQRRQGHLWLTLGAVYFGMVFWLTREINVPINNALALWNPAAPPADWLTARERWNTANLVRTVAAIACFGAATVLLACGRRLKGDRPRDE
jgi:uncharacterized membrane protein